jgi:hypothetical protein
VEPETGPQGPTAQGEMALHLQCPFAKWAIAVKPGVPATTSRDRITWVNFWESYEGWVLIRGESAGKVCASTL